MEEVLLAIQCKYQCSVNIKSSILIKSVTLQWKIALKCERDLSKLNLFYSKG